MSPSPTMQPAASAPAAYPMPQPMAQQAQQAQQQPFMGRSITMPAQHYGMPGQLGELLSCWVGAKLRGKLPAWGNMEGCFVAGGPLWV